MGIKTLKMNESALKTSFVKKLVGGKQMKKKLIGIITAITLVSSLFMVGCSGKKAETAKETKTDKVYKIATDLTYAPFEFEKDGKYTGIDVELLEAIAKLEGFKYELKPMNFNGIIPALNANQIDGAIAGMSITDERKKVLDFSQPYYETGIVGVVKAENNDIKSAEDFKGKKFAVKKGTTGSFYAEENKDKLGATIRYFEDSPSMFQEVINGNADITFEDYPVIAYSLSLEEKPKLKIVGDKLTKGEFGFGVKKGTNKELLDMFNDGLKKLKENGEYEKILNKYK